MAVTLQGIALCWEPRAVAYLDLSQACSGCPISAQLWAIAAALLGSCCVRKAAHQLTGQLAALSTASIQVPDRALDQLVV